MATGRLNPALAVYREELTRFCQRWKITELALFGSARGDQFRPDSDVDVLATFAPDANWGLFDQVAMEVDLSTLFGRRVDLVSRPAVERSDNWYCAAEMIANGCDPFNEF